MDDSPNQEPPVQIKQEPLGGDQQQQQSEQAADKQPHHVESSLLANQQHQQQEEDVIQQQQQQQQQQQPPPPSLPQQQQSQLTSTSFTSVDNLNPLSNSNVNMNSNNNNDNPNEQSGPQETNNEHLFSTKRWGTTPVRQDTPWELPPSPTQTQTQSGQTPLAIPPGISHVLAPSSRFEQPWRAPMAPVPNKPTPTAGLTSSSSFANHNLMNAAPGSMQKSMLNSAPGSGSNGGVGPFSAVGSEFARAPGPATSILDANSMTPKPFGMAQRASTWSSFGTPAPNDTDSEWPKSATTTTTAAAGISTGGNSAQPTNAFDLVPDFEPGKSWHGSNLMKSLDDDSPINLGGSNAVNAFPGAYAGSSKSPTSSQYEPSGIGTWSPIVKGARSSSMWDNDGPDGGRGDNGRFDDGTAIWGSPAQNKVAGIDWADKLGDANSNNDKSRSNMVGNNQSNYRPQQSSSSTSLLVSSNTSPSSQHNRNQQQTLKQPSLSHNFDQVQQQSNALSSQANQPNRGLGLSSNVPSKHQQQLTTMVQQIQLAVQAGHLNPQILNQPLAPVTLQLLYQLLQQIRSLHQLQMKFSQPGNHQAAVSVQMTKTKQNILNLQNQIAAQQAIHLKQQQQQTQAHNISSRQPTMPNLATGGVGGGIGPALPPGISQSGDSFRSSTSVGDFHGQTMVNNFGVDSMNANGLANSLGHMNLGGASMLHSSRFDQPWRAPANKHQASMASSSFANHNLMNAAPGGMQKSMLSASSGNGGSPFVSMQQGGEFARAPGPATSMMDNNMAPKPFGMTNRSASTWSAFGNSGPNDSEPEWPKTTTSGGISSSNATQPSNAFDLVPEFEPGKPWRGSMLMRSVEDDPTMTPGSMARSLAPQRKTIWSDEIL